MSKITIKEYPLRHHPDYSKDLVDVCSCGHSWYMHEDRKNCHDCLCSTYEFQQTLNRDQVMELDAQISRDREKRGLTQ